MKDETKNNSTGVDKFLCGKEYKLFYAGNATDEHLTLIANVKDLQTDVYSIEAYSSPEDFVQQSMEFIEALLKGDLKKKDLQQIKISISVSC